MNSCKFASVTQVTPFVDLYRLSAHSFEFVSPVRDISEFGPWKFCGLSAISRKNSTAANRKLPPIVGSLRKALEAYGRRWKVKKLRCASLPTATTRHLILSASEHISVSAFASKNALFNVPDAALAHVSTLTKRHLHGHQERMALRFRSETISHRVQFGIILLLCNAAAGQSPAEVLKLEITPKAGADQVQIDCRLSANETVADVKLEAQIADAKTKQSLWSGAFGQTAVSAGVENTVSQTVSHLKPELWSPHRPALYDLTVTVLRGGADCASNRPFRLSLFRKQTRAVLSERQTSFSKRHRDQSAGPNCSDGDGRIAKVCRGLRAFPQGEERQYHPPRP